MSPHQTRPDFFKKHCLIAVKHVQHDKILPAGLCIKWCHCQSAVAS